jgi:hypothetical protein
MSNVEALEIFEAQVTEKIVAMGREEYADQLSLSARDLVRSVEARIADEIYEAVQALVTGDLSLGLSTDSFPVKSPTAQALHLILDVLLLRSAKLQITQAEHCIENKLYADPASGAEALKYYWEQVNLITDTMPKRLAWLQRRINKTGLQGGSKL